MGRYRPMLDSLIATVCQLLHVSSKYTSDIRPKFTYYYKASLRIIVAVKLKHLGSAFANLERFNITFTGVKSSMQSQAPIKD